MKTTLLAAAAVLSLGMASLAPAFAEGEGNGEPFPGPSVTLAQNAGPAYSYGYGHRDVGSAQYPDVAGNPGTHLTALGHAPVLPAQSNEAPIQTANSLPRGFEDGTVAYAQAQSMNAWVVAHNHVRGNGFAAR